MLDRRAVLAAAPALLAAGGASARGVERAFPKGFLWGAASAPHQVEGNNVNSDCWFLENLPKSAYAEPSGDAANSFELWRTDLGLVRDMGLNTYRFGIEWARIEPEPNRFSIAMLDHYKAMIGGCRALGLTPVVSFNHFSTPRWFAVAGGWAQPDAPALFARYCERAARHLAADIAFATTLNEPNVMGKLPLMFPPGVAERFLPIDQAMAEEAARRTGGKLFLAGNSLWVPNVESVQQSLLAAHSLGRQAIKAVRGDLPVGVTLAIVDDQAAGPAGKRDEMRARLYGDWLEAAKSDDFVGVQNYERAVWDSQGRLPTPKGVVTNASGAEVYPASLAGVVRYAHAVSRVPVMVTEHGVNSADDGIRAALIPQALAELQKTIDEGVPVIGYIHWALIDNFEWAFGYGPKFGLHMLDRSTFARTPKPSAAVFAAIAKRNSLS